MINSKDLVRRAITFRSPERVPYNFDSNRTPVITEDYGDDFAWVFSSATGDAFPRPLGNDRYVNEFGVVNHRPGATFGSNGGGDTRPGVGRSEAGRGQGGRVPAPGSQRQRT